MNYRQDELRVHKQWPTMAASLYWKLAPKLDRDDTVRNARQLRKLFFRMWSGTVRVLAKRYGEKTLRRHIRSRKKITGARIATRTFRYTPFSLSNPRRARMFSLVAYASLAKKLRGMEIISGMLFLDRCTSDADSKVSSLAKEAYAVFNRSLGTE